MNAAGYKQDVDRQEFSISSGPFDGAYLIDIEGEVDLLTAPDVSAALTAAVAAGERRIVVDCVGVRFMDSKMLEALYRAVKQLRASDGALAVACSDDHICRIFELLAFDALVPIRRSREEALASLN